MRVIRSLLVHSEYYAGFKQKHGPRAFTAWVTGLLQGVVAEPENAWAYQVGLNFRRFVGWVPECGKNGMVRISLAFQDYQWAYIDRTFETSFSMWLCEMLEDEMISPARRAEKLNHWRLKATGVTSPKKKWASKYKQKVENEPDLQARIQDLEKELAKEKEENKKLRIQINGLKHSLNAAYDFGSVLMYHAKANTKFENISERVHAGITFFNSPRNPQAKETDSEKPEPNS